MPYQLLAVDYDNTLVPFGETGPRPAVAEGIRRMQAGGGRLVQARVGPPHRAGARPGRRRQVC